MNTTMKHQPAALFIFSTAVLIAAAWVHEAAAPAEADVRQNTSVIAFQRQTLVFNPTRDDITVGRVKANE